MFETLSGPFPVPDASTWCFRRNAPTWGLNQTPNQSRSQGGQNIHDTTATLTIVYFVRGTYILVFADGGMCLRTRIQMTITYGRHVIYVYMGLLMKSLPNLPTLTNIIKELNKTHVCDNLKLFILAAFFMSRRFLTVIRT